MSASTQPHPARPTNSDYEQSASFTRALQAADGAFAWEVGGPADLGATSTALRVFSECQVPVPRRDAVLDSIEACFDETTSGFALAPGGPVSLHAIAEGHVALATLGLTGDRWTRDLVKLVNGLVSTPIDAFIASAVLDTVGLSSPDTPRWASLVLAARNAEGTWGEEADLVAQTALFSSALLKLGFTVPDVKGIGQLLLDAQTASGGWGDGTRGQATLAVTYRVTRVLQALSLTPDTDTANTFIRSCRQPDGAYAGSPAGEQANLINTYFALTSDRWLNVSPTNE